MAKNSNRIRSKRHHLRYREPFQHLLKHQGLENMFRRLEFFSTNFQGSIRTAVKTPFVSITKANKKLLFRDKCRLL